MPSRLINGVNDLETMYPNIAKEWHPTKNGNIKPSDIKPGSNKQFWWLCPVCNEKYLASPNKRTHRGDGCPFCSHHKIRKCDSLGANYQKISDEWDYDNNNGTPFDYAPTSNKLVSWVCGKCNQTYLSSISNRVLHNTGCPICANLKIIKGINDLQTLNPLLALEWNYERNEKKADEVGAGSGEKVWWKCEFGHEWVASIVQRNNGSGCPTCIKHQKTSLQEQTIYFYIKKYFPDAINSYKEKNLNGKEIDIYIPRIKTGIEYDGHFWHTKVDKDIEKDKLCCKNGIKLIRVREKGCIFIERKDPTVVIEDTKSISLEKTILEVLKILGIKNPKVNILNDYLQIKESYHKYAIKGNLKVKYPELAKEWHPIKNGSLKPENIPATGSSEKYFWLCSKHNYSWKASLDNRIRGRGCPVCAGKIILEGVNDLATTHPELAKEWHPTKNGSNLTPYIVSKGSHKKIVWICNKNHEYIASIGDRVRGTNCPYCAGKKVLEGFNDLATTHPDLLEEWDYNNNTKTPNTITKGSSYKANWICHICNHRWSASVYSRTAGCGCPKCSKRRKKGSSTS